MAATVQTRSTYVSSTSDANSFDMSGSMPSGIQPGDILICIFSVDGTPTATASGWNKLGQASNSTVVTGAVFWKKATGGDTITVSTGATNEQASAVLLRISGGHHVFGTSANGSSTNSNPPSHNAFVSKNYLWIATRSGDSTVVATAAPTNYTDLQTRAAGGTSGASTNTAERTLTASSTDPGTFTSNTEQWVSWTLAVIPEDGEVFVHSFGSNPTISPTTGSTTNITVPEGLINPAIALITSVYDPASADRALSSVTMAGAAQTPIVECLGNPGGDGADVRGYLYLNPSSGTNSFVIAFVGTTDNHTVSYVVLGNVRQSGQPDSTNSEIDSTPDGTPDISTTVKIAESFVYSGGDFDTTSTTTAPQVEVSNLSGGYVLTSFTTGVSAGLVTHNYSSGTGENYEQVIFSISPASNIGKITQLNHTVRRASYY